MSKLSYCVHCGQGVFLRHSSCPHCSHPSPHTGTFQSQAIALSLLMGLGIACDSPQADIQDQRTSSEAQTQTALRTEQSPPMVREDPKEMRQEDPDTDLQDATDTESKALSEGRLGILETKEEPMVQLKPPTRPKRALYGKPSTTKERPETASISRVIKRKRAILDYCYKKALAKKPNLQGKVLVEIQFSKEGTFERSRIVRSSLLDQSVESCIQGRLKRFKFPKISNGPASWRFPLRFSPEDSK